MKKISELQTVNSNLDGSCVFPTVVDGSTMKIDLDTINNYDYKTPIVISETLGTPRVIEASKSRISYVKRCSSHEGNNNYTPVFAISSPSVEVASWTMFINVKYNIHTFSTYENVPKVEPNMIDEYNIGISCTLDENDDPVFATFTNALGNTGGEYTSWDLTNMTHSAFLLSEYPERVNTDALESDRGVMILELSFGAIASHYEDLPSQSSLIFYKIEYSTVIFNKDYD